MAEAGIRTSGVAIPARVKVAARAASIQQIAPTEHAEAEQQARLALDYECDGGEDHQPFGADGD